MRFRTFFLRLFFISLFLAVYTLPTGDILLKNAFCGNIESIADPNDKNSAMYTLSDLYNRLVKGTPGARRTGPFVEPSSPPGSTGHTLNDIMDKAPAIDDANGATAADVKEGKTFWGLTCGEWGIKTGAALDTSSVARVAKTGQTSCHNASGGVIPCAGTGQDGDLQKGVSSPVDRLVDNGDGSVTDKLTGLIWLKNANCQGFMDWESALVFCNSLHDGQCGLTDGSSAGDWRLPNLRELNSLIDYSRFNPAMPDGHPFINIYSSEYWTSTSLSYGGDYVWDIYFFDGLQEYRSKGDNANAWAVRGGD